MTPQAWGLLSGAAGAASFAVMIQKAGWPAAGQRRSELERKTWAICSAQYLVLLAASFDRGARASLWIIAANVAGNLVMLALAARWGTGTLRLFTLPRRGAHRQPGSVDRVNCVLAAGVALALAGWWLARSSAVAIVLLLAVDTLAVGLTVVKTWRKPGTESLYGWGVSGLGWLLALPALGRHAPAILAVYPAAGAVLDAAVIAASLIGAARLARLVTARDAWIVTATVVVIAFALSGARIAQILLSSPGAPAADVALPPPRPVPVPEPAPVPPARPARSRHRHAASLPSPLLAVPQSLVSPAAVAPAPGATSPPAGEAPPPATSPAPSPAPDRTSPYPSPGPSPSPSATVSPSPYPDPTPTPSPSTTYPDPSATPTPSLAPSPTPSASPSPTSYP